MTGLDRMNELCRGAGRGQGRGDLPRDMTTLAQSGDDDPPAHGAADLDGRFERAVERLGETFEPADLGADDPPGDGKVGAFRLPSRGLFERRRTAIYVGP